jgi:hypothetical protein
MTILDTNVISELMKPLSSPAVLAWTSGQAPDTLFTTSITVAEVLYGVELLPKGKRRDQLLHQADATFAEDFAGRILFFDEQAARIFAPIAASRRRQGKPMSEFDAQIAAISRAQGATLATRNTADFEGCGVRLVNPWVE